MATYESIQLMLASENVEFVTIATPSSMHHAHVLEVLAAGKHCLTDKPPAMNTAEWDEMGEAACKAGVTLCCYQNARWNPHQRAAMAAIADGRVGRVEAVKLMYIGYSTVMRTYGVTDYRPQWRAERRFGGGILYDFGPHHLTASCRSSRRAARQRLPTRAGHGRRGDDGFLAINASMTRSCPYRA